jgi:hypothetical protein
MVWWPDQTGRLVGRLVSVLLGASLIGLAWGALSRLGGWRAFAALAVAVTPMTVNLVGAINPNGLEIAAGVLLFAATLTLFWAESLPGYATRRLIWLVGVAALLLS